MRKKELQGTHHLPFEILGRTSWNLPLLKLDALKKTELLVIAGIHGEESETVFFLSRVLRMLPSALSHVSFVLNANPEGSLLGTRGNSRGVDLNRNFPAKNWKKEEVLSRPILEMPPITRLSPGRAPESEPETRALIEWIKKSEPKNILSIHSPIGCIDAPERNSLVRSLEEIFHLPWKKDIGYPTPGSLGSWCAENNLSCVTLELPRSSGEEIVRDFAENFAEFLLTYGE